MVATHYSRMILFRDNFAFVIVSVSCDTVKIQIIFNYKVQIKTNIIVLPSKYYNELPGKSVFGH